MEQHFITLEFDKILNKLKEYAMTEGGKERLDSLKPYLSESELRLALRDTTEARTLLDKLGTVPIPAMDGIEQIIESAVRGEMLRPEQLTKVGTSLNSVKRLVDYMKRGKDLSVGLAFCGDELNDLPELREEIFRVIRNDEIDDYASENLQRIRKSIINGQDKIKQKADSIIRNFKNYLSDSFIVNRNGHVCIPVKKEYKLKVSGSVIDKSTTGSTYFIEPSAVEKLNSELSILKIEEENEEIQILYTLSGTAASYGETLKRNIEVIQKLDFIFSKGKLSFDMNGKVPDINTERRISIQKGRHPLLERETCVPLDFEIGTEEIQGIIITGPNTGGKTVAIKTVGLFCLMAQCGLHIPCEGADICMNDQVLCDIGDGQNITQNLSTFSSHITKVMSILERISKDSLVILDELGSGTDPQEGMGIAIAILEELKKSGCLFVVTTHYPEVKLYADRQPEIKNARMAFDRESLKPLYRLEIGKAGESCALFIAGRLGMTRGMLERAAREAYSAEEAKRIMEGMPAIVSGEQKKNIWMPKIQKLQSRQGGINAAAREFHRGDCVMVYPDEKIGIIAKEADSMGRLVVQMKKEKKIISHKRLKLHVAAEELYPEDYDFSIIFDTAANRKARKKMSKGYQPDMEIKME